MKEEKNCKSREKEIASEIQVTILNGITRNSNQVVTLHFVNEHV